MRPNLAIACPTPSFERFFDVISSSTMTSKKKLYHHPDEMCLRCMLQKSRTKMIMEWSEDIVEDNMCQTTRICIFHDGQAFRTNSERSSTARKIVKPRIGRKDRLGIVLSSTTNDDDDDDNN